MAKILVTYDSTESKWEVIVNGEKMENVEYVSFQRYKDYNGETKQYCSITMYEDDGDIKKVTQLMAAESPEGRKAQLQGAVAHKSGLIVISSQTKAQADIQEWFKNKKKK